MTLFSRLMEGAGRTRGTAQKPEPEQQEMLAEHTPMSRLQHKLYYLEMQERMVASGAMTHLPANTLAEIEKTRTELEDMKNESAS